MMEPVLGLILGGCFQDPLGEGAHFINAGTHKTFPGLLEFSGNLKGMKNEMVDQYRPRCDAWVFKQPSFAYTSRIGDCSGK